MKQPITYLAFCLLFLTACEKNDDSIGFCGTGMYDTPEPKEFPFEAILRIKTEDRASHALSIDQSLLILKSRSLTALDIQSGDAQWSWTVDEDCPDNLDFMSIVPSDSSKILIKSRDGMYGVNLNSGQTLWSENEMGYRLVFEDAGVLDEQLFRLARSYDGGYLIESKIIGADNWDTAFSRRNPEDTIYTANDIEFYRDAQQVPMAILSEYDRRTKESKLLRINLQEGSQELLLSSGTLYGHTILDVNENYVIIGGDGLIALDLSDLTTTPISGSALALDGNRLYLNQEGREVRILKANTLELEATFNFDREVASYFYGPSKNMAAFHGDKIYARTNEKDLVFRSTEGENTIWGKEPDADQMSGFRHAGVNYMSTVNHSNGTFAVLRNSEVLLLGF